MIISDLSYLEEVSADVNGGDGYTTDITVDIDFSKYVTIDEYVDIYKNVSVDLYLEGNTALANAQAQAYGNNTTAQALTLTNTTDYSSDAFAESFSGTY